MIDEAYFLTRHGQAAADFPAGLVNSHLFDAENELRKLTSDTDYDAVEEIHSKDPAERTIDEIKKHEAFIRAEAELVMMCLIPKLNVKIGREGIVTSSFSKIFGEGNFKIATPEEIEKIQNKYMDRAAGLVKKYIPTPGFVTAAASLSGEL